MFRNRRLVFSLIMLFIFALSCAWSEQAEARRMERALLRQQPSYQRSAPQPSSPQRTQPSQTQPSPQSLRHLRLHQGLWRNAWRTSHGWTHRLLLFGGMHTWGGPGLLDIIVFGGLLFLLSAFSKQGEWRPGGRADIIQHGLGSQKTWGSPTPGHGSVQGMPVPAAAEEVSLPEGFDQEDFMKGAKPSTPGFRVRGTNGTSKTSATFTSKEVWEEINRQPRKIPSPARRKSCG